jgi:hypothetical protein
MDDRRIRPRHGPRPLESASRTESSHNQGEHHEWTYHWYSQHLCHGAVGTSGVTLGLASVRLATIEEEVDVMVELLMMRTLRIIRSGLPPRSFESYFGNWENHWQAIYLVVGWADGRADRARRAVRRRLPSHLL